MKLFKFLLFFFVIGCAKQPKVEKTVFVGKKYFVVSSFNDPVFETNNKEEAFEKAKNLTMLGRAFLSKPIYFVVEK